jgi:hypothetical protein
MPFYCHDERGLTEWSYPVELSDEATPHEEHWRKHSSSNPGIFNESLGIMETIDDTSGLEAADELALREEQQESNHRERRQLSGPGSPFGNENQHQSFLRDLENESTDESSDDDDPSSLKERAMRLGGGFRTAQINHPPELTERSGDRAEEEMPALGASSLAMMDKLNQTRAVQQGDVMTNQAAFKADGMLMLESIENKKDPTDEHEDDAETIARLAGERVKMQEVSAQSTICF